MWESEWLPAHHCLFVSSSLVGLFFLDGEGEGEGEQAIDGCPRGSRDLTRSVGSTFLTNKCPSALLGPRQLLSGTMYLADADLHVHLE